MWLLPTIYMAPKQTHESIVSFIGNFLNIPRFHHICILKVNKDTIFAKKVYWMRSKGRDKEIWLKFNRIFEIKTSHIFKNWAHLFWNSTCHNTRVCCKSLSQLDFANFCSKLSLDPIRQIHRIFGISFLSIFRRLSKFFFHGS